MTDNRREDKYWICDKCVQQKYPEWTTYMYGVSTVINGLCGHCDRTDTTYLTPICDFKKPGQKFFIWD